MFKITKRWWFLPLLLTLASFASAETPSKYPGIGRAATPAEIKAWDIDVRPDFTGLPAGSGSVAKGQAVWEAKCASCHGTFGESNEVFSPLVGGTTAEDIKVGRVKALQESVARTTFMKVSSISTLWDYINRAMPWNAPKSLSTEEVYASLAYLLHLARGPFARCNSVCRIAMARYSMRGCGIFDGAATCEM
jgi:S-disulfanyl-L-cysteine oxidoreductase SoxD